MASPDPDAPWPWGQRPPYPPPLQREGEWRSLGPEGRGDPWRPHQLEEPGGSQWPPGMEEEGSCGVSTLESRGSLPPEREKDVAIWGGIGRGPQEPPRDPWSPEQEGRRSPREPPRKRVRSPPMGGWLRVSLSPPREDSWEPPQKRVQSPPRREWQRVPLSPPREDSWEPPRKRVRSPPMGGWLRDPLSPPKRRGWTSPDSQRPPDAPSTHRSSTPSSSGRDTPESGGTPWVSRDGWDGPRTESMGSPRESPVPAWESCRDRAIPPPASGRERTGRHLERSSWAKKPSSSSSSSSSRGSNCRGGPARERKQRVAGFSLQTQREVLDTLAPATALYKMTEAALDRPEGVDPLAVGKLARRLLRSARSASQKLQLQRCLQILESIDPRLTPFTTGMTDLNSGGLHYAEDKVGISKGVPCTFPSLPEEPPERNSDQQVRLQDEASLELWHRRFGHADSALILQLQNDNLATGIKVVDPGEADGTARCLTCLSVKGDDSSFSIKTVSRSTALMDLIHCELYGPFDVPSLLLQRYVLIFVDDYSSYCVTFLLKETSEIHRCFEIYLAKVSKKHKSEPKAFQMNSAADAISPQTQAFLEARPASHKRAGKGQSRTAERVLKSLLEMTRCMLADAKLPRPFWGHAIVGATYLWNLLPVSCRKMTPFQAWDGIVPCVNHLRVFGSLVRDRRDPNDPAQRVFVAYSHSHNMYRLMNLETGMFHTKGCLDFDERQGVEKRGSFLATVERQVCGVGYNIAIDKAVTGQSLSVRTQPERHRTLAVVETREETSVPEDKTGDEEVEADKPTEAPMPQSAPVLSEQSSDQQVQLQDEASLDLWHRRFGHADSALILRLQSDNLATGIKVVDPGEADGTARCLTCLAVKGDDSSFSLNDVESSAALMDLIHCELYGPFDVPSIKLQRYVLLFLDDYSRFCATFLLKETSETHQCFEKYLARFSERHKSEPKAFQMNSAADSISPQTLAFLEGRGIAHKRGVECMSGQSRTAEREMKFLLEMTRCMLADAKLPGPFWGHAIVTAAHLWNLLPVSCEKRTPFQAWTGQVPRVDNLCVFGSLLCNREKPNDPTQHVYINYIFSHSKCIIMNLETGVACLKRSTSDFDERQGVAKKGSFLASIERQGGDTDPFTVTDREVRLQNEASLDLWHRRFGHADSALILRLQSDNLATGIQVIDPGEADGTARCLTCLSVKGDDSSFSLNDMENSSALMDLVHCELYGPFEVPSLALQRYALLFVDDYSRFCVTFLLKETRNMQSYFDRYFAMLKKSHKLEPKAFQMNSAADSILPHTLTLLAARGIAHKRGVESLPGPSRTAEREMKSLLGMTRGMLADANLPGPFWGHAILAATYLWNRLPVSRMKRTPLEDWTGKAPCVSHLRVFGSLVRNRENPNVPTQHVYLGYIFSMPTYRVMDLETGVVDSKVNQDFDERQGAEKRGSFLASLKKHGSDTQPLTCPVALMTPQTLAVGRPTCQSRDKDVNPDEATEASMPQCSPTPAVGHSAQPAACPDPEEMPANEPKGSPPHPPCHLPIETSTSSDGP